MNQRTPDETDRKVLPESVATRVLARAVELDQMRTAGSSVADLRSAAAEAGISAGAFDAALAELEHGENVPAPAVPKRAPRRVRVSVIAGAAALLFAFFVFMRIPAKQAALNTVPNIEEAIMLRCLSPDEAGEMIRLALGPSARNVQLRWREPSRLLTVRATPEQLQRVKALLAEQQAAGSAACATQGTPPGTR